MKILRFLFLRILRIVVNPQGIDSRKRKKIFQIKLTLQNLKPPI